MPVCIEDALDFPIVREVIQVAGEQAVTRYLEFELMKLSTLVSVGGNFNNAQIVFIAKKLIQLFPNETLADFKLCFDQAAIGQYNIDGENDIFRMDGIVIRRWMEKYLEKKYEVIEDKLMRPYTNKTPEKRNILRDSIRDRLPDGYPFAPVVKKEVRAALWLKKWREDVSGIQSKRINTLTTEEILQEGQRKPKQQVYQNGFTPEFLQLKSKLLRVASDFYSGRASYSNMKLHLIGDHEIFAETESDAKEIYAIATKTE